MKITKKSLEKSLELQKINLDLGYDQTRMPTEDYITLVQAHLEALEALRFYSIRGNHEYGPSSWVDRSQQVSGMHTADLHCPMDVDMGNVAHQFLSKHGGVE